MDERKDPLWSKADRVCKALRRFARGAPSTVARVLIVNGRLQSLRGQTGKAVKLWREALNLANRYDNRFDRALALHELGKHRIPQCDQYRAEAQQIFSAMGAAYYLAQDSDGNAGKSQ